MTHGNIANSFILADYTGIKSSYTYYTPSSLPTYWNGVPISTLTDTAFSNTPLTISSSDFHDVSSFVSSNISAVTTNISDVALVSFSAG